LPASLGALVGLLLMQLIFNVIVFENGRGTISISSSWDPSSEAPSC
jgi:galactofuranose transport system permease protein